MGRSGLSPLISVNALFMTFLLWKTFAFDLIRISLSVTAFMTQSKCYFLMFDFLHRVWHICTVRGKCTEILRWVSQQYSITTWPPDDLSLITIRPFLAIRSCVTLAKHLHGHAILYLNKICKSPPQIVLYFRWYLMYIEKNIFFLLL